MRCLAVAALLLASAAVSGQNVVEYNHLSGEDQTLTVEVKPGDSFLVKIRNTCPASFQYEHRGFVPGDVASVREPTPKSGGQCTQTLTDDEVRAHFLSARDARMIQQDLCAAREHVITIDHLSKFSAYLIDIQRKNDAVKAVSPEELKRLETTFITDFRGKQIAEGSKKSCEEISSGVHDALWKQNINASELKGTAVIVMIDRTGINVDLAGGATISWLTDPKFAVLSQSVGNPPVTQQLVIRDKGAEDDYRLGFAGFIHASHSKVPNLALSMGFGIEEDNKLNYLVGASWRLGNKVFATAGINFASVDRLPAGQQVGQAPNDPNVLSSLGTRTDSAFFLSLSYSFLSPGQSFFNSKFTIATKDSK